MSDKPEEYFPEEDRKLLHSDEDFNEGLKAQESFITDYFDKKKDVRGFVPMLAVVGRVVEVTKKGLEVRQEIALCDLNHPEFGKDRFNMLRMCGEQYFNDKPAKDMLPVAVFILSEAWLAKLQKEEVEDGKRMKDVPKRSRREVVIASGYTFDERINMSIFDIKRRSDATILGVEHDKRIEYTGEQQEFSADLPRQFYVGYTNAYIKEAKK